MAAVLGNTDVVAKRQHLLDPTDYSLELKEPNPGKPPNNKDPFPVDLKIEELETHKPEVYVDGFTVAKESAGAGIKILNALDAAEKRIIKLENNMATLMRYLFRLGSRVQINCVYYGGQTPFQKYCCIRCLADDRVSDGAEVQIDQCMNCTRYEPIHGQMYECLNDLGANVATILDDNQAGFSNMEKYSIQTRVEKYHDEPTSAAILMGEVQTRASYEKDLDSRWGKGIAMNWQYIPKDKQKPHVNWRQSIEDDGSQLKRLASFPQSNENFGSNLSFPGAGAASVVGSPASIQNAYNKNKADMDAFKSTTTRSSSSSESVDAGQLIYQAIQTGKEEGAKVDDTIINKFKCRWTDELRTQANGRDVPDILAMACICLITNENGSVVADKISSIRGSLGTKNDMAVLLAYKIGVEKVTKYVATGKVADDTLWTAIIKEFMPQSASSSGSSGGSSGSGSGDAAVATWPYGQLSTEDLAFVPRIVYLYCALLQYVKTSSYDGDWAAFPFTEEQIETGEIFFTSKFGYRSTTKSDHHGIDLAAPQGMEIHAIADGTVLEDATIDGWADWNAVIITHSNGLTSKYLHCNERRVSGGMTVAKGQVIGTVGGYGPSGPNTYPMHLHLEIGQEQLTGSKTNPIDYYPVLNGCEPERGGHYYDLKNKTLS